MIKSYFMLDYLKLLILLRYFLYTYKKAREFEIDYGYEDNNNVKSITDPIGSVTEYTYYAESSPSGDGRRPVIGRDVNSTTGGYLQSIVIDKGNDNISQTYVYDPLGNITKTIDGEGVLTTYGYDNPFGEVNVITWGASESEDGQPQLNLITTFDYDENGNMIGQTSRGITTGYEYDRLNRLRFKRYKGISDEGEIVQVYEFKYDNNSNLTEIIYPRGNSDIYSYNERDLVQGISYGNGLTTESFTYTTNGYLNTFTDGENKVYTYVHDSHGRLKDIIDLSGNKVSYGYDENSNVERNFKNKIEVETSYDEGRRPKTITHKRIQDESVGEKTGQVKKFWTKKFKKFYHILKNSRFRKRDCSQ